MIVNQFGTIMLRPHWTQYIINELPFLILNVIGWTLVVRQHAENEWLLLATAILSLYVYYQYAYISAMKYRISSEQILFRHGVLQRDCDYIELYRVVDYYEHQSLMQQLFGLKTISIYSGDRTNPRLDIIGVPKSKDLVSEIRTRVEMNKIAKGIREITNI